MDSIEITPRNPSTENSGTLPSADSVNKDFSADPPSCESRSTNGSMVTNQGNEIARGQRIKPKDLLANGHLFHFGWHIVCIPFKEPDEICRFTFMPLSPPDRVADPGFCSRKVYKMGGDDRSLDRECVVLFTMDSQEHVKEPCDLTHHDCLHYLLTYGSVTRRNYTAAVEDGIHGWPGDTADGRLCFLSIILDDEREEERVYSNFERAQSK
jgi:hypothetical protein